MYKSYIITQAWVYLLITLAKQRAFVGKSDMIYDRPSETVQLQSSKTYSGTSVQNVTCKIPLPTPLPIYCSTRTEKPTFCVRNGGTLISIEKVVK